MSAWAVLAAGGRGERLGSDLPKAFAPLAGRALLAESLERLDACDWIDGIVVVVPAEWEEPAILLAEEVGCSKVLAAVAGGPSRGESVQAGLAEVPPEAAVVLVHDAARPLVSDEVVGRVIAALGEGWDGAVPGLAVADTIKRLDGSGRIVETPPRSSLRAVQTPQGFVAAVLRSAFASGDVPGSTDCASLVEAAGGRVTVVEGDPRLLKITGPDDLVLVESWLA